jgi:hypothetical protein
VSDGVLRGYCCGAKVFFGVPRGYCRGVSGGHVRLTKGILGKAKRRFPPSLELLQKFVYKNSSLIRI